MTILSLTWESPYLERLTFYLDRAQMNFEKKNTYDFIVDCSISNASAMEILQFALNTKLHNNFSKRFSTSMVDFITHEKLPAADMGLAVYFQVLCRHNSCCKSFTILSQYHMVLTEWINSFGRWTY